MEAKVPINHTVPKTHCSPNFLQRRGEEGDTSTSIFKHNMAKKKKKGFAIEPELFYLQDDLLTNQNPHIIKN